MININLLRTEFDKTLNRLKDRNQNFSQLDNFPIIDKEWRELNTRVQTLNAEKNNSSKQIGFLMASRQTNEIEKIKVRMNEIKKELENIEARKEILDGLIKNILYTVPNIPHISVPVGKNEKDNPEVKKWGTPTNFDFEKLAHWDLAEKNKLIDFERSTKVTGARYIIYTGRGAKLIRALQSFTLDQNITAGFYELLPPVVVCRDSLIGTGQLPKFEEDLYKLNDGMYLSPTGEVQMTNFYRNEILNENELPKRFTTSTGCFRSEAGSAGRDTRGVIRQHQFYKTEMVIISNAKKSYDEHEFMTEQAEKILEALNLPYRRIVLCTGDMGFGSAKTYDIEVWLPSYDSYKEISSCSNCEDFQARNLMTRYKDSDGNINYVHTLNGSGLAIDRLWAAVVENYQQADGSIKIPEALQKYFDGETTL